MRDLFRRLVRLEGTVDRRTYALCGLVGFAIKYAIDSSIASAFGKHWRLINYWYLASAHLEISEVARLLIVALPFIWFGVTMTLLRARDAGISPFTVVLFFVPVVNLIYFTTLMLKPSVPAPSMPATVQAERTKAVESAILSVLVTTAVTIVVGGVMTKLFQSYGVVLFAGLPFFVGFSAATLHGYRYPRSAPQTLLVAFTSLLFVGGAFLAVAWEGVICLLMAAPIAITLTLLGALFGYFLQRGRRTPAVAACVPLALPLLMIFDPAVAPLTAVRTSIEIAAPPQVVWKNVVEFSEIREAPEWFFRTGIAYPLRARIRGHGPGAVRHCIFTTGAFVEPIDVWDEPHRLAFAVARTPAPMEELSLYANVRPPHLEGFLVSERGEFLLEPLSGGKTRLTGTTWYRDRLYPPAYWQLWSDAIIHRIHLRVLRHIRTLSESSHPQAASDCGTRTSACRPASPARRAG